MVLLILMNICIHARLRPFSFILSETLNCTCETASDLIFDMILRDCLERPSVPLCICILILEVFLVSPWGIGCQNIGLIHFMIPPALFVSMLHIICHDCILAGVTGSLTVHRGWFLIGGVP